MPGSLGFRSRNPLRLYATPSKLSISVPVVVGSPFAKRREVTAGGHSRVCYDDPSALHPIRELVPLFHAQCSSNRARYGGPSLARELAGDHCDPLGLRYSI